jgi:hypothetical protein
MKRSDLPIASPCTAKWDTMTPVGRGLFCDECKTVVHDLSAMKKNQAANFMNQQAGQNLCIKYAYDSLGNVKFADSVPTISTVIPVSMLRPSVRAIAATAAIAGGAYAIANNVEPQRSVEVVSKDSVATHDRSSADGPAPRADVPLAPPADTLFGDSVGETYSVTGGAISGYTRNLRRDEDPVQVTVTNVQTSKHGLDKAIVRRYIKRQQAKLQYCYVRELLVTPDLSGTVVANIEIAPDGSTTRSHADGVDEWVESCVAGVLKNIEFPSRPLSTSTKVQATIKMQLRKPRSK